MNEYNFAYLDEQTKRMIRRALLAISFLTFRSRKTSNPLTQNVNMRRTKENA